ncbi:hypothetical protein ACIQZO_33745 [Streptomyces sp. NPDC097617]|uniref:LmrA/YxaF family transcription factor n=1 Tax=Streptomyces sp. NPDC097617 TaxID=3366091 RepID=UPI00382B80F1
MLAKPTYTGGVPASRKASRSAGSGSRPGRNHAPVRTVRLGVPLLPRGQVAARRGGDPYVRRGLPGADRRALRAPGRGGYGCRGPFGRPGGGHGAVTCDAFTAAAQTLRELDFADACPIATVALEVASTHEPLRRATAEVFASRTDGLGRPRGFGDVRPTSRPTAPSPTPAAGIPPGAGPPATWSPARRTCAAGSRPCWTAGS